MHALGRHGGEMPVFGDQYPVLRQAPRDHLPVSLAPSDLGVIAGRPKPARKILEHLVAQQAQRLPSG
jgi:hypothetical protein